MYDFYYAKLLEDPSRFAPRPGNRCVILLEPDDTTSPVLLEREIAEPSIIDWIEDDSTWMGEFDQLSSYPKGRLRLRLLIGSPEQHQSDAEILPLPMSRETFETVRTDWNMPKELLRMMLSTLPVATEFRAVTRCGEALSGLMLRSARSRDWNFCLGLVHDRVAGITHAIVNGLQGGEVAQLLKCLRESCRQLSDPMLLPMFLLELKVHYFAVLLEKRAEGIEDIELATGMRHGFSSNARRKEAGNREREKLLRELNFYEITQKLTGVTGTLSFCDMTFASSLRALELVCMLRNRPSHAQSGLQGVSGEVGAAAIETRLAYLRELIVGAQAHSGVLSARTKAQVQTVYSMIGQNDNRLNIETAAASRNIAEISLGHNTAMKEMAEDSRNIAILTRKDSTDMRIIAVVTLLFLPGTFMATFFSADFFNFSPGDSKKVVSKWIWLYFVLTGAATLVIFAAWYLSSKTQNQKVLTAMNMDTRPPIPTGDRLGNDAGVAGLPPTISPLWRTRSRLKGDTDPFTSFGSSPEALKDPSG